MSKIFEASELPESEKVFLKKDFLGWRVVHPNKDSEGKTIWMNMIFGGKRGFVILLITLLFIFGNIWYTENHIKEYKDYCEPISKDPVAFCEKIGYFESQDKLDRNNINYTLSQFNLTEVK